MDFNKNSFSELEHNEMQKIEGGGWLGDLYKWFLEIILGPESPF